MQKHIHTHSESNLRSHMSLSRASMHDTFNLIGKVTIVIYWLLERLRKSIDIHNAWISALLLSRIGFYQQINHTKHLHVNKYLISFWAAALQFFLCQWTILHANWARNWRWCCLHIHRCRFDAIHHAMIRNALTFPLSFSLLYRASSANQHS